MARRPRQTRSLFSAQGYSSDSDSNINPLSRSIVGEPTEQIVTSFSPFDWDDLWERPVTTAPTFTDQTRQVTPEPELIEMSYDTVPETNKPESETETIEMDTNMVGESSKVRDDPMGYDTKNDDPKVIKLNLPKDFSGKREDLKKFLQQVNLYMDINAKIYHNDMTKIAFVLSFMDEGDTSSWKEQFLEEATSTSPHNYGTWTDFERNIKEAFQPFDAPGDALEEIKNLWMGNNSIEDHNVKFWMLLTKSKLDKTSPAVIDYYRETLNLPLQKWYNKSTKYDNLFRKIQRITRRGRPNNDQKEEPRKKIWTFTKKDPNAMDVDLLSTEKRDEAMRKGLCFGCGKHGHLNQDCPDKKKTTRAYTPIPSTSKKMNAKELYAHIWSLTAQMDDKEKERFYDEAEKEGV